VTISQLKEWLLILPKVPHDNRRVIWVIVGDCDLHLNLWVPLAYHLSLVSSALIEDLHVALIRLEVPDLKETRVSCRCEDVREILRSVPLQRGVHTVSLLRE
jgi:hypothetical protein